MARSRTPRRRVPISITHFVVPLGATTASVVLYWSASDISSFSHILLIASIVSPFPAGLILGLWWPGRHLRVYVIQGIAIGFLNMVGMLVVHGSVPKTYLDTAIFSFVFGGAMLYVSGAWIGDWIEGRRSPGPSSLVRMIAQRLGGDELAAKFRNPAHCRHDHRGDRNGPHVHCFARGSLRFLYSGLEKELVNRRNRVARENDPQPLAIDGTFTETATSLISHWTPVFGPWEYCAHV